MKLTRSEAIDYSIELWEYLKETGLQKEDWPEWERFGGLNEDDECKEVDCECFLCEYSKQRVGEVSQCARCPYYKEFDCCVFGDTPYDRWCDARQIRTRKKYASLFLEQLKAIRRG